jgi:hypothetical protein
MAVHPYTRFFILPSAPTVDEDETEGYEIGDVVFSGGSFYDLSDATAGAAVWLERGAGGASFNDAEGDASAVDDAAAGDGASTYAARRDHIHPLDLAAYIAAQTIGSSPDALDVIIYRRDSDGQLRRIDFDALINNLLGPAFGTVFAGILHDHDGTDSPILSHFDLSDIATFTHGDIDNHLNNVPADPHTQYPLKSILTNIGDMVYASASSVWARIAGNTSTTRKFLRQVGSAFGIPQLPAWDTLQAADIPDISATYAIAAKGVTNGDTHNHVGGDGAALTYLELLMAHGLQNTIAASTTNWTCPGVSGVLAAENAMVIPKGGTLRNLTIRMGGTQPASGSLVCTLRVNGADTALVVTIPAGSTAGNYQDTTHTVALSDLDRVGFKIVNNATGTSGTIAATVAQLDRSTS